MANRNEDTAPKKLRHKETIARLKQKLNSGVCTSEATAPKFASFVKSKEKWDQYLQRYSRHLATYGRMRSAFQGQNHRIKLTVLCAFPSTTSIIFYRVHIT